MAESILNHCSDGRFVAYSAGSCPRGQINPQTLEFLLGRGYDTTYLRSKSWDEFESKDAPIMDFIFTVCDDAAGEYCPLWPGKPVTAHWGLADPSDIKGSDYDRQKAYTDAYSLLEKRIIAFLLLDFESLSSEQLEKNLREIGTIG